MARLTDEQIKRILEEDTTTFDQAPKEASTLDALAMYFSNTSQELNKKTRELVDAISDTYNAAIAEGYLVGFRTALSILEAEPSQEQIEQMVNDITTGIVQENSTEVESSHIGELVMEALKNVDEVAYVRFASVYRHFEDTDEFIRTIRKDLPAHESDSSPQDAKPPIQQ